MKKILTWMIIIFSIVLVCGIVLNYYIQKQEPEEVVCYKGKLLIQMEEGTAIYTRVKGLSCEYEKGRLIIEEQS